VERSLIFLILFEGFGSSFVPLLLVIELSLLILS
jgi:hypothetical protein